MDGYRRRVMDDLLKKKLQAKGAVLIEGPKWCGKTTTAEEIAASKVLLARADVKSNFKSLLEIDADAALSGEAPMLIDEWQTVPKLWDAVRYTVDHRRQMGQFILTGSAVPDRNAEKEREHSGVGRFAWLTPGSRCARCRCMNRVNPTAPSVLQNSSRLHKNCWKGIN